VRPVDTGGQCMGGATQLLGRRRLLGMGDGVAVIGAGSWGTAVAALVSASHPTTLWARSPQLASSIEESRENATYLPGVDMPSGLTATSSLEEAVSGAGVIFMAVPSHGFRAVLTDLKPFTTHSDAVISLAKGIESGTHLRMSEVISEVLPGIPAGVLTGPNLAREVAEGQPAACVVALPDEALARRVQDLLHTRTLRVYMGTDVVGCEVAGATKNVMAIAAGICDGLGFGENTRAVLITRGLAELGRLGIALGGRMLTFGGLAGIGDLVATCASPKSRNRTVGFELGRGRTLDEIVNGMQMVAEGVKSAGPLMGLARANDVEMPIVEQVESIVKGRCSPRQALMSLMERPSRPEWDEVLLRRGRD
jgi:glycerol-3-phosphate dehydrogenase (NAD(P)+)